MNEILPIFVKVQLFLIFTARIFSEFDKGLLVNPDLLLTVHSYTFVCMCVFVLCTRLVCVRFMLCAYVDVY